MEYIKLLHSIIKEQNDLLAQATATIDALRKQKRQLLIEKLRLGIEMSHDALNGFRKQCGLKEESLDREAIARALEMRVEDLWPNNHKRAA